MSSENTGRQQFEAAVKLIQSLPKGGGFQPSNELMLKFYAYYKQATLGQCTEGKPYVWEVIKKAKWDAWHRLGDMSSAVAMENYVNELKTIIETMPQSQEATFFLEKLGSFYDIVDEPVPGLDKLSPRESSPAVASASSNGFVSTGHLCRTLSNSEDVDAELNESLVRPACTPTTGASNHHLGNSNSAEYVLVKHTASMEQLSESLQGNHVTLTKGHVTEGDSESEGDEFCDTSDEPQKEDSILGTPTLPTSVPKTSRKMSKEIQVQVMHSTPAAGIQGPKGYSKPTSTPLPDVNQQIAASLVRLQQDMATVIQRLNDIEGKTAQAHCGEHDHTESRPGTRWLPFSLPSRRTVFLILVWPLIVHWVLRLLFYRRRTRRQ